MQMNDCYQTDSGNKVTVEGIKSVKLMDVYV